MSEQKDTFYFIAHTHWEGAVFKTREEYLDIGLPIILQVLQLLKRHAHYRFTLDQVCYIKPFLERYPEEADAFRRFVREGRLAIVGGTDVMLDVNMPGGESFVRQVLYGKRYIREALGTEVTSSWQLDTFGHHAQMPQLLTQAGFNTFWFFRGVPGWETPSEFAWEGLDGSRIPAFWLPHAYANVYGSPDTLPEFLKTMTKAYDMLEPFARGAGRVGLAGADVCEPEPHVPVLVEALNRLPDRPFSMQIAVPADYEAAVAARGELPVVSGELNPIFQGIYSSRIALKQRTRALEVLLTTVEKLGALLRALGQEIDDALLWQAWEPMLFNQAHDLMSGVMTDGVHEDSLYGYEHSRRLGESLACQRRQQLSDAIDTRGDGIPLVVHNMLGWARTDAVTAKVGFSDTGACGVRVLDPDGAEIPCQLANPLWHDDGSLRQAEIVFIARKVPALGLAVYRVLPVSSESGHTRTTDLPVLDNRSCRLELDPRTGAISALTVKDGNWEALRAPGNVVAMEEDNGDFWELYRPLDAGSRIGMTERHLPPAPGQAIFSTDGGDAPGTVTAGAVFSEFTVTHPFGDRGRFHTTVRLYNELPRVEFRTVILNNSASVRYRALFPTALAAGERTDEIPFGAIRRPDGVEYPAQHWIDVSGEGRGVALLNRGLPGNNSADGTLMLSLMRSTEIVAYGHGGGYEGQGSSSGFELGKEFCFEYALLPHAGDWRQAAVYREGQAFNHPLIAATASSHPGPLPAQWGLLEISHENLLISAVKTGRDGQIVLRAYEAAGLAVEDAAITFAATVQDAEELNLMEDPLQSLVVTGNRLHLAFRPFEIKTIGVSLHAG